MVDINLRRSQQDGGRPVRSQENYESEEIPASAAPMPRSSREGGSSKGPWIVLLTIVVIVVALGLLFRDKLFDKGASGEIATTANYQAIFLTNGQVYFGNLTEIDKAYLKLNDIYYLQVTPVLQTGTPGDLEGQPTQQQQQQLSLVKLGNELHGPVDEMFINRDHVLFIEDLKEDGRVVQAIKDYEAGQQ